MDCCGNSIDIYNGILRPLYLWNGQGKNLLLALFFPVNESVWEHIKLGNIPIILWWGFYYFINSRKYNLDKDKWFTAELAALEVSMITTPALYYLYTGAFGAENLIVDILIFFLAILFAQLLGLHFYRYYKVNKFRNCNSNQY